MSLPLHAVISMMLRALCRACAHVLPVNCFVVRVSCSTREIRRERGI